MYTFVIWEKNLQEVQHNIDWIRGSIINNMKEHII